ncbi:MAG TPA: CU044_2847 family protein [Ktedonobacteraceae bacterium]|nr:CU044_2847 family protein [Ktedonobacteraceae bacterium]
MAIMRDIVKDDNGNEVPIYIEFDAEGAVYDLYEGLLPGEQLRGPGIPDAKEAFQKAMGLIHTCAVQVAQTIQGIPEKVRPAACEVQLSVKLSTGIAALVNASSEAQLQVTLKWGKQEQNGA